MKFLHLVMLFLFASFLSCGQTNDNSTPATRLDAGTQKRVHALIFAIGNYPKSSGFATLSSLADAEYLRNELERKGVPGKNITIVKDGDATIEGIKKAFDDLTSRVSEGDIVVVHFSSHGAQLQADENSKHIDGLDECVVSYNAISSLKEMNYEKNRGAYLRGYMLGGYLKTLREKLGKNGDVAVFLDFCCSAGATRGLGDTAIARGGMPPLVSSSFKAASHQQSDTTELTRGQDITRGGDNNLASLEVIAAARPYETDYQTWDEQDNPVGSLTYAVSKALEQLKPGETYRSFFAQVQTIMNVKVPKQNPVLEGSGSDREVLGGAYIAQQPFIEVKKINNPNSIVLNQGLFGGLNVGAKIDLYPVNTHDPSASTAQKLASGVVAATDNFTSTVRLDNSIKETKAPMLWAFVTQQVYQVAPVGVYIEPQKNGKGFTPAETANIKKGLATIPFVNNGASPELLVSKKGDMVFTRVASNMLVFDSVAAGDFDNGYLKEKLADYWRYKFLKSLDIKDNDGGVEVKLVPVINGIPDTNAIQSKLINGKYEFEEGDVVAVWVKNNTNKNVWVNILDLAPTGQIASLWPNTTDFDPPIPPDACMARGHSSLFSKSGQYLYTRPPYGNDVLKIFVADTVINMEKIATSGTRGIDDGNLGVLEQLVNDAYKTRDFGQAHAPATAHGSTFNLLFGIKPKRTK